MSAVLIAGRYMMVNRLIRCTEFVRHVNVSDVLSCKEFNVHQASKACMQNLIQEHDSLTIKDQRANW